MPLSHRQLLERGENPIHRDVHIPEFKEIVREELDIREAQLKEAFGQMVDDVAESVIGSYSADVTSVVQIGFDNAKEIFESKKTQTYISRAIVETFKDELHKRLKNLTIK